MDVAKERKMVGVIKRFSPKEHSIYDTKGKEAWIKYLTEIKFKNKNYTNIENSNEHGIDVLTLNEKGEVIFAWEIEVRNGVWKGDVDFPFDSINCIERKDYQWRKEPSFLKKIPHPVGESLIVYYVQLNSLCNRAVVINGSKILENPLIEWKNKYVKSGEYVRQVPISETKQVKMYE